MSNTQRPNSSARHTVVEEGTEFKGTLSSTCPIDVRGRIEGDLATPALTVSASGAVHGKAKVGEVRSEGELSGEFDADSVELAGTVRDNTVIRARSLEVKLASTRGKLQVIFGECELSVGDEPTEHDRVEPPVEAVAPVHTEVDLPAPVVTDGAQMAPSGEAAAAADDEEEGDEEPADATAADPAAQGTPGKRRKKRKNGQAEETTATTGWTSPPSQPPPAS
jgi:cytoskeletal protein CcmA (bactofilin family)